MSDPTVIDARGHRCPVPSLRLRKALQAQPPGTHLTLLATDPMARIDVPHLMSELGGQIIAIETRDDHLAITVATPAAPTG